MIRGSTEAKKESHHREWVKAFLFFVGEGGKNTQIDSFDKEEKSYGQASEIAKLPGHSSIHSI